MAKYERKEHLKALHEKRKAITQKKVDAAIKRLIQAQKPINFNSVANESGITKATLYNNCLLYTSDAADDVSTV